MEDKELINSIFEETGIEVTRIEEVEDHHDFEALVREVPYYYQNHPVLKELIRVDFHPINTIVFTPEGAVLKIHNALDYVTADGSVLRISAHGEHSLELTRIQVAKENRNQGFGTLFMELAFNSIERVLGCIPEIHLECTGAVGFGETLEVTSVSSQIQFFKRLGFELTLFDEKLGYAKMTRPASDFGWDTPTSAHPPYAPHPLRHDDWDMGLDSQSLPF
jgi:GNAT superfamily N-acetyltransferase